MKKILLLPLLTLLVSLANAQFVSISGTVADPTGHVYNRGTGRAILVSGNGSGAQNWTYGGTNPVRTPIVINALDSFGSFTGLQLMNTSLIDQQSAQPEWEFQFSSFDCPPPASFTTAPIALTSSQNLSTFFASYAAPLPATCIGSSGQAIPGGYTGQYQVKSATATFAGTNIIDPTQFPGADIGAKINAATSVSVCTEFNGCRIMLPAGIFPFSTTIVLPSYTTLAGGGVDGTTELDWTPSSGTAISISNTYGVTLREFLLRNNVAASTAEGVVLGYAVSLTYIIDVGIGLSGDTQGFSTNLEIGGTDTQPSSDTVVRGLNSRSYVNTGIYMHHAIGNHLSQIKNYAILGSGGHSCSASSSTALVIDTGVSGIQGEDIENGCGGTTFQNSMPTTNPFGYPPQYIFFSHLINDQSRGNGMLFAASLDTPSGPTDSFIGYDYTCVGCWHSGSVLNGVDVQGGTNIKDVGSVIRANVMDGVKLEGLTQTVCSGLSWGGSCGGHTNFVDETMNDNGGASGYVDFHVLANVDYFNISDSQLYGTGGGDASSGTDVGIKIESGTTTHCTMHHNQIYTQRMASVINMATGNQCRDDLTINDAVTPRADFSFPAVAMGIRWGQYVSGGTISGSGTCDVASFNGGGTGATATVAVSGGAIAVGTPLLVTATGSGYWTEANNATLSNGTGGTCSGTIVITTQLGGASGSTTRNYIEVGDQNYWIGYDSGGAPAILFGNGPDGGSAINYQSASNSGLGQINLSIDGSPIVEIRPSSGVTTVTNNLATVGTMSVGSGGSTGHTVCWKTNTLLSYCTSVVASDGTCTCN